MISWFNGAGWRIRNGAEVAPGEPGVERDDYGQVILVQRSREPLSLRVVADLRLGDATNFLVRRI